MTRRKGVIAAVYLAVSFANFGLINAESQHSLKGTCMSGILSPRGQMGASAFFALLPGAGTIIALLGTGFGQYGWNLKARSCPENSK